MQRSKIVATIGPASRSRTMLTRLIDAGMDVARLNLSHGTHDEHREVIRAVREIAAEKREPVAILLDLSGPKIRVGTIREPSVTLEPGAPFTLTTRGVAGDAHEVSVTQSTLPDEVRPGDPVLLSDGAIELKVESIKGTDIGCRVIVGGLLSSHKGLNLPTRTLQVASLTDKDQRDLEFGITQGVDFVALSFVRSADDVQRARSFLQQRHANIPLIAKIEKHEALAHLDAIIALADGVMVARGDLGVDVPLERVPGLQKDLIARSNRAGKPVITATQMLRSMVDNPRPTRAEVTDVANAILDGTDAIMLSEETAAGRYPYQAVAMMARIADVTEASCPYDRALPPSSATITPAEAVAHAACRLADEVRAAAIVTFTQSGGTARLVAKYRPRQQVIALTPIDAVYRRLALSFGVMPLVTEPMRDTDDMIAKTFAIVARAGLVRGGERVVITAGVPVGVPGSTNMIKVAELPS